MTIAHLRRLRTLLGAMPNDNAAWAGAAIDRYMGAAGSRMTLDRALGLTPRPGRPPWWREERLAQRDTAIQTVAAELLPGLGLTARAVEIAEALRGCRSPRDGSDAARRTAAARPAIRCRFNQLAGTDQRVPGARQIERILRRAFRHQLPEAMSETTCHLDPHERLT